MDPWTLIPQRLCFGPIRSVIGGQTRLSFGEMTAPEFREGRYGVCHYHERALGGCVGPLALDQMLWFGLQLDTCLKDPSKFVAVQYEAEERQNVAVVTGAYLVLGQGWSADEVRRALPEDAGLTLPCSWIHPRDLETCGGTPQMTVQDCWEGVQIARDLGWLSRDSVRDGVLTSLAASRFWKTVCQYDGSWLVPGVVFVMADPMTTIKDPSPATCASFCRELGADPEPEASLDELRAPTKCSSATPPAVPRLLAVCEERGSKLQALAARRPSIPLSGDLPWRFAAGGHEATPLTHVTASTAASERDRDGTDDQLADASVHTVCKAYGTWTRGAQGYGQWPNAKPFVEFLLEEGVAAVVRVNMPFEPGLAEIGGSYDAELLAESGVRHADILVSDSKRDHRGAVPPHGIIRRFLSLARDINPEDGSAILVHCKGGFGRSVFLACLLVIDKYDVSGRGILGWARIARPGAITTPEQEAALRSLSGRMDLCRRYGIPCEGRIDVPIMQGCCTVS